MQLWHLYVALIGRDSSGTQQCASRRKFLFNREMRTFSRIRAHQSTSETFDTFSAV